MINKDFEEFPEHRTNFFLLLQSVNTHCFQGESLSEHANNCINPYSLYIPILRQTYDKRGGIILLDLICKHESCSCDNAGKSNNSIFNRSQISSLQFF